MLSRHDLAIFCRIPENWYWVCTLFFALFALFFIFRCYKSILKARSVQDTPTSKIRSAAQGYVELIGKQLICPQEPTTGYLTHKPCTWYSYKIEHYDQRNRCWEVIETGKSKNVFCIHDGTGLCYIDPEGADISAPTCDVWFGRTRRPTPVPQSFWAKMFGHGGSYRYTELRMEDDKPIYVCGNLLTLSQKNVQTEHRLKKVDRLVHAWDKNHALLLPLLLNLPLKRDEQKQDQPPQEKPKEHLSPTINVLSKHGLDSRHPFIISSHEEHKLVRGYQIDAFIWGLSFLGVFTLVTFLIQLRLNC